MENHQSALDLLELLSCPGFCVKDGAIIRANQAASQLLLGCGTALAPLLHTGSQEYEAFTRSEERRVGKECRSRWSPYH